ncbi:MAG TPA: aspartate-semialdehyde dehydrogenase [Longimicrobiaceae bacterium]
MNIAVLGATGAVGRTMLDVLAEREVPVERLVLLASARSAGRTMRWKGGVCDVAAPTPELFRTVDYALFSAGAERSREWGPIAAEAGAVVIDNSSAWRTDPDVPLVVPEVNAAALADRPKGIIANPNCSTIQCVVALRPFLEAAGLSRVIYTTFQSVSGAGEAGRETLRSELKGEQPAKSPFSRTIRANAIPQIGDFDAEGWTGEEKKMRQETRKILSRPDLHVTATCVRVPVEVGHSVQITIETERDLTREQAEEALRAEPGLVFAADAAGFPTPLDAAGKDEVYVGRLRTDPDLPRTFHLWVVADNLRKGAATNAVQILEALLRENRVGSAA